jgi:hypothetical protein
VKAAMLTDIVGTTDHRGDGNRGHIQQLWRAFVLSRGSSGWLKYLISP